MRATRHTTNLVLVGAWNPGVLQPNWLARHAFNKPEGEDIPVTLAFSMAPGAPPKFTMEGITFVPSYERLVINPANITLDDLNAIEHKAISILETLPHTPVSAFGENFEFIDERPTPELLRIFELNDPLRDHFDADFESVSTSVSSSLQFDTCVLNLVRQFSRGSIKVKFNFHYETVSAADAVTKLRGSFSQNFQLLTSFLNSYNTTIESDEESSNDREERITS